MQALAIHFAIFLTSALTAHAYDQSTCREGRTVIVHLFCWKWSDIAAECERFLGPKGFCGVQVSPANEHKIVSGRPWWERYQPVSYKLDSRSGTRAEFIDMVERCNNVGVGIYVDAVINHMTGAGGSGTGTGGSYWNGDTLEFSGVPFSSFDFNSCDNCPSSCNIENYGDANQVRNCRLVSLLDLKLSSDYVRQKIADFMNDCIAVGVAGFRVDAAKHMWPGDMQNIYGRLNNLNTRWWPGGTRPFIFNEVIDQGGEPITSSEYTSLGIVTEFKFSVEMGNHFRRYAQTSNLRTIGESWGFLSSWSALTFVDNHDNQRGHGAGGSAILTHLDPRPYKMAVAFTLAHPYGHARIMSSYEWNNNGDQGPPAWGDETKSVPINPDGTCGDGWLCEHRWRQITNMVKFRNVVYGTSLENWWDNSGNQLAFSRGNKGFIVINNEDWYDLNTNLNTGMPEGTYCDIISGDLQGGSCTGKSVYVDGSGRAQISIGSYEEDPMIAFHTESRVGSGGGGLPTSSPGTTQSPPTGLTRTVVLMYRVTSVGQDLFLRGGIDHDRRPGCTQIAATSSCAIAIYHRGLGADSHYDKYNAWREGDNFLDWYGDEPSQGWYQGSEPAYGTPTAWTTNQAGNPGYQEINTVGEHHWLLDVDMDCDATEGGWFELKGFLTQESANEGWETDINQVSTCSGSAGGSRPYTSNNHLARCGFVNIFSWNSGACTINNF